MDELRFAPPFPNTWIHVRVFGNECLSSKFMTVVRKHLRTGDRNRKKSRKIGTDLLHIRNQ
jgi:hypothetical protein